MTFPRWPRTVAALLLLASCGGGAPVPGMTGGGGGAMAIAGGGAAGSPPVVTANGAIKLGPPGSFAIATEDDVFWVDDTQILHARRDGTSLETVAAIKPYPFSLVLGGDTLYWVELGDPLESSVIKAVPTAGGDPVVVLAGVGIPGSLVVLGSTLYFTSEMSLTVPGTATLQSVGVLGTSAIGSVQTIASFANTLGVGFSGAPGDWLVTTASSSQSGALVRLLGDAPPATLATLPYAFGAIRGEGSAFLIVGATFGTDTVNSDGALLRLGLEGGTPVTLQSGLRGIYGTQLLGSDVYWFRAPCSICQGGAILRAPQAGGPAEVVMEPLPKLSTLVVDAWGMVWSTDAMYAGAIP